MPSGKRRCSESQRAAVLGPQDRPRPSVRPRRRQGGLTMPASHELAPSLADLLCTMAEEDADAETIDLEDTVWAGLLRDGADVVQRLREQIEANDTVERDEIDAEDWAALDHAFGVIVRRDSRHRTVSARAFADEEEPGRRVAGRAGVVYIGDDWTARKSTRL